MEPFSSSHRVQEYQNQIRHRISQAHNRLFNIKGVLYLYTIVGHCLNFFS